MEHGMYNRFGEFCERIDVPFDQVAQGWATMLCGLYGEPRRHYHGQRHVLNLLDRLHALKPGSAPGLDRIADTESHPLTVTEIDSERGEITVGLSGDPERDAAESIRVSPPRRGAGLPPKNDPAAS